jgi:beta-glucanase (GH16 family)
LIAATAGSAQVAPTGGCNAVLGSPVDTYDIADSPYVPHGYIRAAGAEFNDTSESLVNRPGSLFISSNRRLAADGDPNTARRLHGNGEREIYSDSEFSYGGQQIGIDPFSISAGTLKITADRLAAHTQAILSPLSRPNSTAPGGSPPVEYSSGMLSTETEGRESGGYAQREGYWEIRARVPAGRGLWSAFWLIGQTHARWDEIDIFEVLGNEPYRVFQNIHLAGEEFPLKSYFTRCTSNGFHTYGLYLAGGLAIFSIDGTATRRERFVPREPFYAVVNLAVGGSWPGLPDAQTRFPASLEIDYLRIYRPPDPVEHQNDAF